MSKRNIGLAWLGLAWVAVCLVSLRRDDINERNMFA